MLTDCVKFFVNVFCFSAEKKNSFSPILAWLEKRLVFEIELISSTDICGENQKLAPRLLCCA